MFSPPDPGDRLPEAEALLDAVDDAIFVHDPRDGTILHVNRAACELCGWEPEEMCRLTVADLSQGDPPYSEAEARSWVRRAAAEGPQRFEWLARHRTGRLFWVEVALRLARLEGGERVVASVRDIGRRKAAEQALRDSEALFQSVFRNAPIGIALSDPGGTFFRVNEALARTLGMEPGELVGRHFLEVTHPDDRKVSRERLDRLLRGEVPFYTLEKRYLRKDGRPIWILAAVSRVDDSRGVPSLLICQIVDISERREAERRKAELESRLRRSQVLEALGRLAGGVAHDFNNILGSILGCVYVARLSAPPGSDLEAEFDQIRALCRRGGEITRHLLTLARRHGERVEPVDVAECLGELQVLLAHSVPKTVRVTVDVTPDLPRIRVDRALLTTALLDLSLNACDAMPQGGELCITCRPEERRGRPGVRISVSDTGSGEPPAARARVLTPYVPPEPPAEDPGVGLSTARAAVAEWGGELYPVEGKGPGRTFALWLPEAGEDVPPETLTPPGSGSVHPLTDRLVLVVEDEESVARLMLACLEAVGYRAERVRTGLEALERLEELGPEVGLVVLDWILPEVGGEEVYRILKGLVPHVPVVLVSGRDDLVRLHALPEHPVVAKPFGDADLLEAVRRALERRDPPVEDPG